MTLSLNSLPVSNWFQDQEVAEVNIILISSVFLRKFLFLALIAALLGTMF